MIPFRKPLFYKFIPFQKPNFQKKVQNSSKRAENYSYQTQMSEFGDREKIQQVVFEIDSMEIHLMLSNQWNKMDGKVRPLVWEIQRISKLISNCKVVLISRSANSWQNGLLSIPYQEGMCCSGWTRCLPSFLVVVSQLLH